MPFAGLRIAPTACRRTLLAIASMSLLLAAALSVVVPVMAQQASLVGIRALLEAMLAASFALGQRQARGERPRHAEREGPVEEPERVARLVVSDRGRVKCGFALRTRLSQAARQVRR